MAHRTNTDVLEAIATPRGTIVERATAPTIPGTSIAETWMPDFEIAGDANIAIMVGMLR
jgi:hypothetical protein